MQIQRNDFNRNEIITANHKEITKMKERTRALGFPGDYEKTISTAIQFRTTK
jgi:hypothetical protein